MGYLAIRGGALCQRELAFSPGPEVLFRFEAMAYISPPGITQTPVCGAPEAEEGQLLLLLLGSTDVKAERSRRKSYRHKGTKRGEWIIYVFHNSQLNGTKGDVGNGLLSRQTSRRWLVNKVSPVFLPIHPTNITKDINNNRNDTPEVPGRCENT
ncbi:hypothetical protein TESG_02423 [Trichophyton tonsurans CBS 112818]|uniref:Uncharacterized protein n=1 Tax=Trichophyton tonsurans (strain CBS 112818) TaxID=647933 RepID=F2RUC6_TRIT1|nr:hypothetical protein TESG_02423 [Trichophyton tonsurans CBS 112818]